MTDRVSRPRLKPPLHSPSDYLRGGEKPLAELLQAGFSEHSVPALWHRIQGRLYQPPSALWRPARRWPLFAALASVATVVALVGLFLIRANSPLQLSSGEMPPALIAEATPRSVELSDGSSIRVAQQSRLEVVSNDANTFVTALTRGSATFEVNPKAQRRWIIEVGLTSVEVVGTRFTVTRTESEVAVSVTKGLVLVRGDTVPGGQQRLGAGQALRTSTSHRLAHNDASHDQAEVAHSGSAHVEAADAAHVSEARVDDLPLADDDDASIAQAQAAKKPASIETDWAVGASRPRPSSAEKSLIAAPAHDTAEPPTNVPLDIEALFAEADRARESGDLGRSLAYFERVITTAPHFDPRRGLAAMSVARMTMRSNPARAAAALRSTLDGMPAALQENANARLVEAYAKSGQTKNAQSAAQRYLERFPNGRRAEDVRRWATP